MNKKRFGKRQWVLAVMVMVLGAAVYLNYYVAEQTPMTAGTTSSATEPTVTTTRALGESQFVNNTTAAPDYFATVRQDRERAREEALAILKDALQDVKPDDAARQTALEAVAAEAKAVEQENAVESLVKAKGFADCVTFIEKDYCHVTVKATSLTEAQTLQIAQIVMGQTSVPAANINIMAVPQ